MKKLIIIFAIIFITFTSANSQYIHKKKSFIHRISMGAGLGAQILAQDHSYLIDDKSGIVNFVIQYQFNNNFSAILNTAFIDVFSDFDIFYTTIGVKYSYLNYKETLFPYIELDLGSYYSKVWIVTEDVWMTNSGYSGRKAFFGGSIGTGLDLKLSPFVTFDLNFKIHSFELVKNNSNNFFTILSMMKINL